MSYGFVYILANRAMPNIFKVGFTEKSPTARAIELSRSTGVPLPFDLVCYGEFEDCQSAERDIHENFADKRVNDSREFFYGPLAGLYEYLERCMGPLSFATSEGLYWLYVEENEAKDKYLHDLFHGQSADPIDWAKHRGFE